MYQQDLPIGCTQVTVEGQGGKQGEGEREGGREAGRRWEQERQESEEGNMGERDVKSKYSLLDRLLIMGHRMFQTLIDLEIHLQF